jgi:hypothetical protein
MTPEEQAALDSQVAAAAKEEELAFNAGFEGPETTSTDEDPPTEPIVPAEPEAGVTTDIEVPPTPEPPAPVYAQILADEYKEVLTKARSVDEIRAGMEKLRGDAFGKLGGLERTLKQIQESEASGAPIEVSQEDLKEIEAEYPDLSKSLQTVLTRVLGKVKAGRSAAPLTPEQLAAAVDPIVTQRVEADREAYRKEQALERLTDRHEDWREVIGAPGTSTEYRKWLSTQDKAYAHQILSSQDPREIAKSLDKFKAIPKAPVKVQTQTTRSQRLAEAIPAKGGGSAPAAKRASTEEDEFNAGYAERR